MRKPIFMITMLIILIFLTTIFNDALYEERERVRIDMEMAYFPNGVFLKQAVMGYDMVAADVVWLKAIQYYGGHKLGDKLFIWLDHIFGIITDLDPQFINAYVFGSLVISEDARKPELAIKLLKKGIAHNPDSWRLYFEAGFIYYLILKEYDLSIQYFTLASERPDVPPEVSKMCRRWAAFSAKKSSDFSTSLELWQEIYQSATDDYTRDIAERSISFLLIDINMSYLTGHVRRFYEMRGRYPKTVSELSLAQPITDPLQGFYLINPETGEVFSSIKQNENIRQIVGKITRLAHEFRKDRKIFPKSVSEMKEEGILPHNLEIPYGTSFVYNSETGTARPITAVSP
ncbi:MAG: hypothetical protein B6244_02660 [Candidatus Cloacimonetes bacterium 4572_55]|nr:MAG: hypothetical protein B6244_02660 [Candidatus Cloacimonetes bacterium 4572_55]